ncbi:MAG: hypothetical protein JW778_02435 [Candidatus Altiarchaeota archaeon]|nr:hypothetical protein [Candidatus Altiarchaeota archaeon]
MFLVIMVSFIPQEVKSYKTKSAGDLSRWMLILSMECQSSP